LGAAFYKKLRQIDIEPFCFYRTVGQTHALRQTMPRRVFEALLWLGECVQVFEGLC